MRIPHLSSGNWGLKLLALVLAVVVYYSIHHSINNESALSGRNNDRSFLNKKL